MTSEAQKWRSPESLGVSIRQLPSRFCQLCRLVISDGLLNCFGFCSLGDLYLVVSEKYGNLNKRFNAVKRDLDGLMQNGDWSAATVFMPSSTSLSLLWIWQPNSKLQFLQLYMYQTYNQGRAIATMLGLFDECTKKAVTTRLCPLAYHGAHFQRRFTQRKCLSDFKCNADTEWSPKAKVPASQLTKSEISAPDLSKMQDRCFLSCYSHACSCLKFETHECQCRNFSVLSGPEKHARMQTAVDLRLVMKSFRHMRHVASSWSI